MIHLVKARISSLGTHCCESQLHQRLPVYLRDLLLRPSVSGRAGIDGVVKDRLTLRWWGRGSLGETGSDSRDFVDNAVVAD